jgi:hypothetical protein
VSKFKNISTDPTASNKLSRTANAIMLLLYFSVDADNLIDKARFIKRAGLELDKRTWNKYWDELERNEIIVRSGIKFWMLSPDQCYAEGRSHTALAAIWNTHISNQ